VIFGRDQVITEPTPDKVARLLGLNRDLIDDDAFDVLIIGSEAGAKSPYATSCPGIFAVGDVRAGSVKRVASSVGEGSVVISAVLSHVNHR
jgi:thioredoxin reductase (NADPH)